MTPSPDLHGTVVVLTHSRTGSSLLMQTLRLLGKPVRGDAAQASLDPALNPRGFYEDPAILEHGLQTPILRADPRLLRGHAVKIALAPMVDRRIEQDWRVMEEQAVVLLPVRHPAETLVSREAFLARDTGAPARLAWFREAVQRYLIDLGYLADRWAPRDCEVPCVCVDYRLAADDPVAYVSQVAGAARLSPTPAQTASAVDNISRDLYRHRAGDGGEDAARFGKGVRILEPMYEILRSNQSAKWSMLRDALPAWALAARR